MMKILMRYSFVSSFIIILLSIMLYNVSKAEEHYMENSNELFSLGNMGDKLLYEGEYHKAEEIYTKLYEKIINSNKIDQYIMSKICLGMMIAKIKLGKRQEAYDIITQDISSITENNWYGIGMTGLRKGMISKRDDLIHGIVYAFFSALEKEPIEKKQILLTS